MERRHCADEEITTCKAKSPCTKNNRLAELATTEVNYQPQMIYVLRSEAAMEKINGLCPCIYGAPMVFLVCIDERRTLKSRTEQGNSSGEKDCNTVLQFLPLL